MAWNLTHERSIDVGDCTHSPIYLAARALTLLGAFACPRSTELRPEHDDLSSASPRPNSSHPPPGCRAGARRPMAAAFAIGLPAAELGAYDALPASGSASALRLGRDGSRGSAQALAPSGRALPRREACCVVFELREGTVRGSTAQQPRLRRLQAIMARWRRAAPRTRCSAAPTTFVPAPWRRRCRPGRQSECRVPQNTRAVFWPARSKSGIATLLELTLRAADDDAAGRRARAISTAPPRRTVWVVKPVHRLHPGGKIRAIKSV